MIVAINIEYSLQKKLLRKVKVKIKNTGNSLSHKCVVIYFEHCVKGDINLGPKWMFNKSHWIYMDIYTVYIVGRSF